MSGQRLSGSVGLIAFGAAMFGSYLFIFTLLRCLFILVAGGGFSLPDMFAAPAHGIAMDCTVAGYLTALPLIIAFLGGIIGVSRRKLVRVLSVIASILGLVIGAVYTVDLLLYPVWKFRLDTTPLFYFITSPSTALGAASTAETIVGILCWFTLSAIIIALTIFIVRRFTPAVSKSRIGITIAFVIEAALLFVAIRGGVTVSTMNPGRVYFSSSNEANQAALNPVFTLLYSATHSDGNDKRFNFFSDETARRLLVEAGMLHTSSQEMTDTAKRPDIIVVILESFSNHLFASLAPEGSAGPFPACRLDSIAANAIVWRNCYASGFRTDRGIPAILSGVPAMPTVSVMKNVRRAAKLPNLARELAAQGYETNYVYGGDADFTNMRAYLVNGGFSKIISDRDFPLLKRLTKWGAHDDELFIKAREMFESRDIDSPPSLYVIQTSSSHEPFEVPYHNKYFSQLPAANAFAFTDSVAADFINSVRSTPSGRDALIVITADHWGAWPQPADIFGRHRVPLIIITPEAWCHSPAMMDDLASQTDIPATILGLLGLNSDNFEFSHNLYNPSRRPFAWMTDRNESALLIDIDGRNDSCVYNIDTQRSVISSDAGQLVDSLNRAYLQYLNLTLSLL